MLLVLLLRLDSGCGRVSLFCFVLLVVRSVNTLLVTRYYLELRSNSSYGSIVPHSLFLHLVYNSRVVVVCVVSFFRRAALTFESCEQITIRSLPYLYYQVNEYYDELDSVRNDTAATGYTGIR